MSVWSRCVGVALVLASAAWADSAKPLDISLGDLGDIPKAEGLAPKPADKRSPELKKASTSTRYTVLKVDHARSFVQREGGTAGLNPLSNIPVSGDPPATEKFSTRIRVQCPDSVGAPIEVNIMDSRGDLALSSNGHVHFRPGAKETDYLVDWTPTSVRGPGSYSMQIRVAGQPMGSWPVTLAEAK